MADLNELLSEFDALNTLREKSGRRKWSDSTLGSYSVRNPNFVSRLREGNAAGVQDATVRRAKNWIKSETAKYSKAKGRK